MASIVLYGSPVWSEKVNQSRDAQKILREMQKRIALRVVSAYRTVAYDAAIILARMPPYHLIAEMRGVMYQRAVKSKSDGTWNKEMEKQILHEESVRMRVKWRSFSERTQAAGRSTREAIAPFWDKWLDRDHGNINFRLTGPHRSWRILLLSA